MAAPSPLAFECPSFFLVTSQLLAEDAKVNRDHRQKLATMEPTELEVR